MVEVGFLDADPRFRSVDDRSAASVRVTFEREGDGREGDRRVARERPVAREGAGAWRVTTRSSGLGGLALDAVVTVRGGPSARYARWSVSVEDRSPAVFG